MLLESQSRVVLVHEHVHIDNTLSLIIIYTHIYTLFVHVKLYENKGKKGRTKERKIIIKMRGANH